MVSSGNCDQIVKKKYSVPPKDRKDWTDFTKQMGSILLKEDDSLEENQKRNKIRKLDLHGYSLDQANRIVKKFITESFDKNYRKLLIVTGKGLRSKVNENPYVSKEMSVLKHSVPDFIKQNEDLSNVISRTETASLKDGGEGAFYVFLKK